MGDGFDPNPYAMAMANRDFLSKTYAMKMAKKSRAATRHEVDEAKAMKLYKRGLSDLNVADLLGVSKGDVYRWRISKGLPSNMLKQKKRTNRTKRK